MSDSPRTAPLDLGHDVPARLTPENVKAARVRAYIRSAEALHEALRADSASWYLQPWEKQTDAMRDHLLDFARRASREGMQAGRLLKKAVKEAGK